MEKEDRDHVHGLGLLGGGAEGIRTPDLLTASQARSQLRHSPVMLKRRYETMQGHPRQAKNPLPPDFFADHGSLTSVFAVQFAQSETIPRTFNVQRVTSNVASPFLFKSRNLQFEIRIPPFRLDTPGRLA